MREAQRSVSTFHLHFGYAQRVAPLRVRCVAQPRRGLVPRTRIEPSNDVGEVRDSITRVVRNTHRVLPRCGVAVVHHASDRLEPRARPRWVRRWAHRNRGIVRPAEVVGVRRRRSDFDVGRCPHTPDPWTRGVLQLARRCAAFRRRKRSARRRRIARRSALHDACVGNDLCGAAFDGGGIPSDVAIARQVWCPRKVVASLLTRLRRRSCSDIWPPRTEPATPDEQLAEPRALTARAEAIDKHHCERRVSSALPREIVQRYEDLEHGSPIDSQVARVAHCLEPRRGETVPLRQPRGAAEHAMRLRPWRSISIVRVRDVEVQPRRGCGRPRRVV